MQFSEWQRSDAVLVKNVNKSYLDGYPVLRNFSMRVQSGTVYGFLGSSGCGKTTLLSCLLGLKTWESGEISVLGRQLGPRSSIQNRHVGYMPQEFALQERLTPEEIIMCYGRLYGMTTMEMQTQLEMLSKLLGISSLSGGQKRRVSLALSLVHSPQLLILDEPTVGLDPLLRERIWNHLYSLTATGRVTIIVTTHYSEELRAASTIGIMRNGTLVIEENPNILMDMFQVSLLPEAVLKACRKDELQSNGGDQIAAVAVPLHSSSNTEKYPTNLFNYSWKGEKPKSEKSQNVTILSYAKVPDVLAHCDVVGRGSPPQDSFCVRDTIRRTLTYAYYIELGMLRDVILMPILLTLPIIQACAIMLVVGTLPINLPFGIINSEQLNSSFDCSLLGSNSSFTIPASCLLIEHISKAITLNPIQMQSREESEFMIAGGNLWGYVEIPKGYSQHLADRAMLRRFAENDTIEGSSVSIRLENSNLIINYVIVETLKRTVYAFFKHLAELSDFDASLVEIPLKFKQPPVYGSEYTTVREYAAPVVALLCPMKVAYVITPLVLLNELKKRTLERSLVAGLLPVEAMVGITLAMLPLAVVTSIVLFIAFEYILCLGLLSSFPVFMFFCMICSLSGIGLGLLLAIIVGDEMSCIIITIIWLPIVTGYMGVNVAVEAFPKVLRLITHYAPLVTLSESLRSVMIRGVPLTHETVWPGLLLTIPWIIIGYLLCILLRRKLYS